MEQQRETSHEGQRKAWNKFPPGEEKWDELAMDFLKPMSDDIIQLLHLRNHDVVLDVASGTGEAGLLITAKLKKGKVVTTDLAEDMLTIACEKATRKGITNIETFNSNVCELPFANNTFDAISCRFGFMFFPDMLSAAREMVRVLKPGGRIATSVWDVPEKNSWITAVTGAINKNMKLPAPPPGAPGMFRCAGKGQMSDLFSRAGLKNISVRKVARKFHCKTTDTYWDIMTDVAAPVVAMLSKADSIVMEKIKKRVYKTLYQKYSGGNVLIDSAALIIYGEK